MALTRNVTEPALEDLHNYLHVLAGEHAEGLLEVRYTRPSGGMRRLFRNAADREELARMILALAAHTDVYTGVALRTRRHGGRQAIPRSHVVYIEIDHPDALERLKRFHAPATMLIASGTPGHLHAYWRLHTPAATAAVEQANRTLAHHLDGDLASVDIARILRPPGTRNHKHTPPTPVRLLHLNPTRAYTLTQLTDGLPQPPSRRRPSTSPRSARRHPLDQTLLTIPAREYARALTGRRPNQAGKLACPFHALSVGVADGDELSPACSCEDASLSGRRAEPGLHWSASPTRASASSDSLRRVPPAVYFERLTCLRVGRSGKLAAYFTTTGYRACTCIASRSAVGIASDAGVAGRSMISRRCFRGARPGARTFASWSASSCRCFCEAGSVALGGLRRSGTALRRPTSGPRGRVGGAARGSRPAQRRAQPAAARSRRDGAA